MKAFFMRLFTRLTTTPLGFVLVGAVVGLLLLRRLYLWLKGRALAKVSYTRYFAREGIFCGERTELVEELRNPTIFPLFSVPVSFFAPDGLCLDGQRQSGYRKLTGVFHLLPFSRVVRTHEVTALRRDQYRMESVELIWRKTAFEYDVPVSLSVYPGQYDAPLDVFPDSFRLGEWMAHSRYPEDPFSYQGIRPYMPGDSPRRVDFKASARAMSYGQRQLLSRACESSRNFESMVLFDVTPRGNVCATLADNCALIENGLRLCCYLLRETLRYGGRFGFAANMESGVSPWTFLPCGGGNVHVKQVLEMFAAFPVYRTARDYSFPAMLGQICSRIPREVDVYLLAAGYDPDRGRAVETLRRRVRSVTVIDIPIKAVSEPAMTKAGEAG